MAAAADEGKGMRARILTICEQMITLVHNCMVDKSQVLTPGEMRNLMFVTREAWYLSTDRFGELTPEDLNKLQALAGEEDDNLVMESPDDEDDDDPFGLRKK